MSLCMSESEHWEEANGEEEEEEEDEEKGLVDATAQ